MAQLLWQGNSGLLLAMAIMMVHAAGSPPSCTTALDCSLNGECAASRCNCLPAWKGDRCDVLNLIPMSSPRDGDAYRSTDRSSWGGSVSRGADGLYHLFVSEMAEQCGLSSYTSNSQIVHATSAQPEGPYQRQQVIVESFAHNPTLVVDPRDGTLVLYHIGCGTEQRKKIQDCVNGTTPKQRGNPHPHPSPNPNPHPHPSPNPSPNPAEHPATALTGLSNYSCHGGYGDPANVYVAETINGPWRMQGLRVENSKWMTHMDNPAPWILSNGTVLLFLRRFPTHGSGQGSTVGIGRAEQGWNGTYVLPDVPVDFREQAGRHWVEDPFLYRHDDGSWHALFHNWVFSSPPVGVHAFSQDGVNWHMSPSIAYTTAVMLENGTAFEFKRRERPHLLLSERGHPEHLFTGVMPFESPQADFSYTHQQRIHTQHTLPSSRSLRCTPVADLKTRISEWVGRIPYSHKTNTSLGYPTDCSGFVSWAVKFTPEKAFEWGSDLLSAAVEDPEENLRFGDIFTHVYSCDMKTAKAYIPGHVFYFDKFVNATHFWAYESTETFDVTPGCRARKDPCYNHHVIKRLAEYTRWKSEKCLSKTHGVVHGGPRRMSNQILCNQ
eukprot:TRINITY_DN7418_c0_g1_i6.p1 TRINITY_DN7418_c0_g1~~TRINITY_DN7418_c0_g1_i6.p1  ORF type:complete len:606 (+),score=78.46 TRINITY_DN7418_c0_g1_i6:190-2007(+)